MEPLYPILFRKTKRTGKIIAVRIDEAVGKIHGAMLYDGYDGRGYARFGAAFLWGDTVRAAPSEYAKLLNKLKARGYHFTPVRYNRYFIQFRRDVFYATKRSDSLYAKKC